MRSRFDQGGSWGAVLVGAGGLVLMWLGWRLNSPRTGPKSSSEQEL